MPIALAILVGAQLIGELLRQALHIPLPGPVIGMFLLAVALVVGGAGREGAKPAGPRPLVTTANVLIVNMGLLFVPAGVGVIGQLGLLRQDWLPILTGLVVSTVLSLVVTGLVMHHVSRAVEAAADDSVPAAARAETR
jgi:holin-like protein